MNDFRRIRSTQAWRRLAKQVIREEPVCWLQLPGCTKISTTADHIIPLIIAPQLALMRSNCRGACKRCNYRRGNTPVELIDQLRQRRPNHRPAALNFFDADPMPRSRTRECEICGATYHACSTHQRTCGRECGAKLNGQNRPPPSPKSPAPKKPCVICGETFTGGRGNRKTCSTECSRALQHRNQDAANARIKERYRNDPAFRQQTIDAAKASYQRNKAC